MRKVFGPHWTRQTIDRYTWWLVRGRGDSTEEHAGDVLERGLAPAGAALSAGLGLRAASDRSNDGHHAVALTQHVLGGICRAVSGRELPVSPLQAESAMLSIPSASLLTIVASRNFEELDRVPQQQRALAKVGTWT